MSRIRARLSAFLVAAALAAPQAAKAQGVAAGQVVTRDVTVAGKVAPLPPGQWIVAGLGAGAVARGENPGAYGAIWTVVLMRPTADGRAFDAMVELNVNDLAVAEGWGVPANCSRKDISVAIIRYKTGWDASCHFVTHLVWDWPRMTTPVWLDAERFARMRGWSLPQASVTSGVRVANRRDVIDIRFHFLPAAHGVAEPQGVAWPQSAWRAAPVMHDERRAAILRRLGEWSVAANHAAEEGLKRRQSAPLPDPFPAVDPAPRDGVAAQRRAALDALMKAGLISPQSYDEQARMLAEGVAGRATSTPDAGVVSQYKTLAYPPAAAASNLLLDSALMAQPIAAGALLLLQTASDGVKFYLHERVWSFFASAGQRDDARTLDFTHESRDG